MHSHNFSSRPGRPDRTRFVPVAISILLFALTANATTFIVNNNGSDTHDGTPGDGVCETAKNNHVCTLRAAIDEANALDGADVIQLQANTTYVLTLTDTIASSGYSADLVIRDSVTINGAGPDSTVINGNGQVTGQGVFLTMQCVRDDCTLGNVGVNISGLTIENGVAPVQGGGIFNAARLSLDHVNLSTNTAYVGGAIASTGALAVSSSVISNNHPAAGVNAIGYGGGIYAGGPTTINNTTISDNSALTGNIGYGGGVYFASDAASVVNTTISDNIATSGGGIGNQGQFLFVVNTTISGNLSTGTGGGIQNHDGTVGLYNATVTENQANADEAGFEVGGGIYNAAPATVMFENSIVAGNTRVIPTTPFATLSPDECAGTLTSLHFNIMLSVDTSHCTIVGAITTADPLLGPLQFNGGPTRTHALAPNSLAINGGNAKGCTDPLGALLTTDQRGMPRGPETRCDIGAYEWQDVIFENGFQSP